MVNRLLLAAPSVLLIALLACSRSEDPVPEPAAAPAAAAPVTAAAPTAAPEADFEPVDAQARAESVVNADFNRDKTTGLAMDITTLIYRTSEVTGLASALAPRQDGIEASLARLDAKVTDTEVIIQLPGSILFDFDSARIRADAERALSDVAQVIRSYGQRPVRVEGHTDSMASDDYNSALSQRRASSVSEWLAANGVERARLTSSGLGETKPVATNETAAGRQSNRRVEVVIARK